METITRILQQEKLRLNNVPQITQWGPGKGRLEPVSNSKAHALGQIKLRARETAMCLYQLLLRPRTILEGQARMEKTGMQGALHQWTAGDNGSWWGRAECQLPRRASLVVVWESTIARNRKGLEMCWDCAGTESTWAEQRCPRHPLISDEHSPGHWWTRFQGTTCHDCPFPNPMTCEMEGKAVSVGQHQHL